MRQRGSQRQWPEPGGVGVGRVMGAGEAPAFEQPGSSALQAQCLQVQQG